MNLYAVIDADGFLLETWQSQFEPPPQPNREIEKKNPDLAEWLRPAPLTSSLYNYPEAIQPGWILNMPVATHHCLAATANA